MSIDEQPMNVYWSGQKSPTSNKYKINYKGTVATASALPATGNKKGDTYNISEDGSDYIWTGTEWDKFGANIYIGSTSTANGIQGLVPPATTAQMYSLLTGMGTWQSAEDLGLALNDEVVHKTGNETIAGAKTLSDSLIRKGQLASPKDNASSLSLLGSTSAANGGGIWLIGKDNASMPPGAVRLQAGDGTNFYTVDIKSDGKIRIFDKILSILSEGEAQLGSADKRFGQLYTTTSPDVSSDERLKQQIASIPDEVLDAWGELEWVQYKFNESVRKKGDEARLHSGLVAQRIETIFKAHGLDACKYGLFCYDAWEATPEEKNEVGTVICPARKAGDEYSLRYEEALAMEAAYQRRRADRAEIRIKTLEDRLKVLETRLG